MADISFVAIQELTAKLNEINLEKVNLGLYTHCRDARNILQAIRKETQVIRVRINENRHSINAAKKQPKVEIPV